MISAGRGEIVDEMIQGDLAGSVCSVAATTCSGAVAGGPGVARSSGRARSVGEAITRLGKCDPMPFEESDGS